VGESPGADFALSAAERDEGVEVEEVIFSGAVG
jgi:hypothetical protein